VREHAQVFAGRGLADSQFCRNEEAADPVSDQVPVDLRREVCSRLFQPFEDLQPLGIGQRAQRMNVGCHIDILLIVLVYWVHHDLTHAEREIPFGSCVEIDLIVEAI
jgi:hypothetical protein